MPAAARRRSAPLFVQRLTNVEPRRLNRGNEAEHESGNDRHRERRTASTGRSMPIAAARGRPVTVRHQQRHTPRRHQHTSETAEARQNHALDDKLPHDAHAAAADRRSHGNLLLPAHRPREQQVGDVGARDQQHERHRAEQHHQRRPHVLHEQRLQLGDARAHAAIELRILGFELRATASSFRPAPASSDAASRRRATGMMPGCQPRSSGSVAAHGPERHVEVGRLQQLEAGRQHTNDRVRLVVELNASSEHVRRSR